MDLGMHREGLNHLRNFWEWWRSELAEFVPKAVKDFFSPDVQVLLVDGSNGLPNFELRAGSESFDLGELDLQNANADDLEDFRKKLEAKVTGSPTVNYIASEKSVLSRTVYLPLAVEHNLSNVLRYEVDKLTPFKKGDVYFCYRLLQRHPEEETVAVELSAMSQAELSTNLVKLEELNLTPSGVFPPNRPEQLFALESFNLLPLDKRKKSEPIFNRDARRFALIAGALLLVVMALPAWYLEHSIKKMEGAIEEKRLEANEVAEKRGLVTSHLIAQQEIAARKNNSPAVLEVLLEITTLLPRDTWTSRMRIDQQRVLLQGVSGKASDLIQLLEQSEAFSEVRFRSPITYDPRAGGEKFEIEMPLTGDTP